LKKLFVGIGLMFVVLPTTQAQNTCDGAARPCLDQPQENKSEVTGQLTAPGVPPPPGAAVKIEINGVDLQMVSPVKANGTFDFVGLHPLSQYDFVEAIQSVPPPAAGAGALRTGRVPVRAGEVTGKTCDKAPRPCLDQPHDGDVKVTGSLTAKGTKSPPGAAVTIKINGNDIGISGQINSDGTFSFTGLNSLGQYDTIEVIQTLPAPAAGLAPPTTGKVKVQAATDSNNLKLSIAPASFPPGNANF
jgi:hypothetical protein